MKHRLSPERETYFWAMLQELKDTSRLASSDAYIQHGSTSVYRHSVAVAYVSCLLAEQFHIRVKWDEMIRAALLHDYFLYDWHDKDKSHRLHGFRHPGFALHNAQQDVNLSRRECEIIMRHMFPLTPVPPLHREGWLVCMADKLCSTAETIRRAPGFYARLGKREAAGETDPCAALFDNLPPTAKKEKPCEGKESS